MEPLTSPLPRLDPQTALVQEVEQLVAWPKIARSPKLKALLLYLLERTSSSETSTQSEIAAAVFGRTDDFDPSYDATVRTSISRLRTTLEAYYATCQADRKIGVFIGCGEYKLRLGKVALAYPALSGSPPASIVSAGAPIIASAEDGAADVAAVNGRPLAPLRSQGPIDPPETRTPLGRFAQAALRKLLMALGLCILPLASLANSSINQSPSQTSGGLPVPTLTVATEFVGSAEQAAQHAGLRAELTTAIRQSLIVRAANPAASHADFQLVLTQNSVMNDAAGITLLLVNGDGRVLAERAWLAAEGRVLDGVLRHELAYMLSPAGPLAKALLQAVPDVPRNAFECFLLVESGRSQGADARALARHCTLQFQEAEFAPYLESRSLFYDVQARLLGGGRVTEASAEWTALAEILRRHPENPYAHALAAKLLIARGQCQDASSHATRAFARGGGYTALELSILVDALGCPDLPAELAARSSLRIDEIAAAETQPYPLMGAYLALAHLARGRLDDSRAVAERPFASDAAGSARVLASLARLLDGQHSTADRQTFANTLPGLVFNPATRAAITKALADAHTETPNPTEVRIMHISQFAQFQDALNHKRGSERRALRLLSVGAGHRGSSFMVDVLNLSIEGALLFCDTVRLAPGQTLALELAGGPAVFATVKWADTQYHGVSFHQLLSKGRVAAALLKAFAEPQARAATPAGAMVHRPRPSSGVTRLQPRVNFAVPVCLALACWTLVGAAVWL